MAGTGIRPALILAVLLTIAVLGSASRQGAASQEFSPSFSLALGNAAAGANSSATLTSTVPAGNHLIGQVFFLVPKGWTLSGDSAVANGDVVGAVSLDSDLGCDGSDDPGLTANLIDVADADSHAHWKAVLGPPLNLVLHVLVDRNMDDPDTQYDISAAVFYSGAPVLACSPMSYTVVVNAFSGLGTPMLRNPTSAGAYRWQAVYYSSPVGLLEHIVSRNSRVCIGSPDGDADGVCDNADNCPLAPNADQRNVDPGDGAGDACDGSDFDLDGFSDRVEYFAGTDPAAGCAAGPGHSAWPADINNDGVSDVTDRAALVAWFGQAVPPAPARFNIAPDPPDGVVDITDASQVDAFFGTSCR